MAKKVTKARLNMAAKGMMDEVGSDMSNASILLNKYSDKCVKYMRDSMRIIKSLIEPELQTQGK